ncbi:hypothetical protein [Rossellomorea marisflavi]|uniref:hypothetical protein n=1 Tax=Rossellomorea marisflavi TaxID=189381 RepID=UPI000A6DBA55|nr:hypothetical protein [Rossellomorea marisflavi]MCM2604128.1 hypothetical protein [Rossellomorea marisflavi]
MSILFMQEFIDFYLSPIHFSILLLFILILLLNQFPFPFKLYSHSPYKRIDGIQRVAEVQADQNETAGTRLIKMMKFLFYHAESDEPSSLDCQSI